MFGQAPAEVAALDPFPSRTFTLPRYHTKCNGREVTHGRASLFLNFFTKISKENFKVLSITR